jgi:hypothetical protein
MLKLPGKYYSLFWLFSGMSLRAVSDIYLWSRRSWASPSPNFMKWQVLRRNSNHGVWIETGTYKGHTSLFLSKIGEVVYSLEPMVKIFHKTQHHLRFIANIYILNVSSENGFEKTINEVLSQERIKGLPINFWLDGHFSGGETFLGSSPTPISAELEIISKMLPLFDESSIFVDDVRCFSSNSFNEHESYPQLNILVDWAIKNDLSWSIEHDIFIARKFSNTPL